VLHVFADVAGGTAMFHSLRAQHLPEYQVAHKPTPGGLQSRCCVENRKDNKKNFKNS